MRSTFLILVLCLAAAFSRADAADLRDVRQHVSASGEAWLWFEFDGQPSAARVEVTESGASLFIGGVSVSERVVDPAHEGMVRQVFAAPHAEGAQLTLDMVFALNGAEAQIRRGGVLLQLEIDPAQLAEASILMAETEAARSAPDSPEDPEIPAIRSAMAGGDFNAVSDSAESAAADPDAAEIMASYDTAPANASEPDAVAGDARRAALRRAAMTACQSAAAAVEADPWDFNVLADHGHCLREAGDRESAAEIYARVLAFEPENYDAAFALAEIRAEEGDEAAAQALYAQAASAARSDSQAAQARALSN